MADIRIKDLTTTASSTASDDFIAVDGATNGTRKLNAYSPSFGGNATVAGKVAINGGDTSASQLAVTAPSNTLAANFASSTTSGQSFGIRLFAGTNSSDYAVKIRNAGDTLSLLDIDGAGKVSLGATTASTSTSTGALVVGGGVGVAGTIYAGGTIRVVGSSHTLRFRRDDAIIDFSNTAENAYVTGTITGNTLELKGNNGTGLTIGTTGNATFAGTLTVSGGSVTLTGAAYPNFYSDGSSGGAFTIRKAGVAYGTLYGNETNTILDSAGSANLIFQTGGATRGTFTSSGLTVNATTASTSTSTGALVVSGGVGVAGAIYAGGNTNAFGAGGTGGANSQLILEGGSAANGGGAIIYRKNGTVKAYAGMESSILGGGSTSDNYIIYTSSGLALTVSGLNTVFGGNIKTAAPSGGTAAEWKLGTVASVSPTSPNRTIEVDIGGTIYYIHAKTTNN